MTTGCERKMRELYFGKDAKEIAKDIDTETLQYLDTSTILKEHQDFKIVVSDRDIDLVNKETHLYYTIIVKKPIRISRQLLLRATPETLKTIINNSLRIDLRNLIEEI